MLSLKNFELLIDIRVRFRGAVPAVAGGPAFTLSCCIAISAERCIRAGSSPSSLTRPANENGESLSVIRVSPLISAARRLYQRRQLSNRTGSKSPRAYRWYTNTPPPLKIILNQLSAPSLGPWGVPPPLRLQVQRLTLPFRTSHIHTGSSTPEACTVLLKQVKQDLRN